MRLDLWLMEVVLVHNPRHIMAEFSQRWCWVAQGTGWWARFAWRGY